MLRDRCIRVLDDVEDELLRFIAYVDDDDDDAPVLLRLMWVWGEVDWPEPIVTDGGSTPMGPERIPRVVRYPMGSDIMIGEGFVRKYIFTTKRPSPRRRPN